jgi:SOS-response transcriptional repressor LexA
MPLTYDKEAPIVVKNEGFVAAGRTVPFPAPETTDVLWLPAHLAEDARNGRIRTLTICGDSLKGVGIFDGDRVVCKKAFHRKEITDKTICIVYIPQTGDTVAKRVRFVNENLMLLQPCNDAEEEMRVHPDSVEIRGVVIDLLRGPDKLGRFDRGYDDGVPL